MVPPAFGGGKYGRIKTKNEVKTMKNKKINIFVNGKYICSSLKYKTCKKAVEEIKANGVIKWAGLNFLTTGKMDSLIVSNKDTIRANFSK